MTVTALEKTENEPPAKESSLPPPPPPLPLPPSTPKTYPTAGETSKPSSGQKRVGIVGYGHLGSVPLDGDIPIEKIGF
jgi:hypothetical protein